MIIIQYLTFSLCLVVKPDRGFSCHINAHALQRGFTVVIYFIFDILL